MLKLAVLALVLAVASAGRLPNAPTFAAADNLVVRINAHVFSNAPKPPASTPMSRVNSISFLAMHEAINSIQAYYKTHYGGVHVTGNKAAISIEAAILGAFNTTRFYGMAHLPDSYFANQILFDAATLAPYNNALLSFVDAELATLRANGVDESAIQAGLSVGNRAGDLLNDAREDDGYKVPAPIQDGPCGIEGQWCSWAEDQTNPRRGAGYPNWGGVRPFSFETAGDFTVPPPYAPTQHLFRASLNSTRIYGDINAGAYVDASFRKEVQVWGMGAGGELGARIVDSMFQRGGDLMTMSLFDSVALFGRLYVGNCDALINNLYNKYKYNAWRPYQAIRQLGYDANWTPFMKTPTNQEYPCGHCEGTAGAIVGVQLTLEPVFGSDKFPFGTAALTVPNAPAVPQFASFSDIYQSVNAARRFGGMHFDFSIQQGSMYGTRIATHLFNTMFQKA
jgi:hypothetical protein